MGLITKQIDIKPVGSNIAYYKSKGYEVNYGELLTVGTEDLPPTCQKIITAQCDNPECQIVNLLEFWVKTIQTITQILLRKNEKQEKDLVFQDIDHL